MNLFGKSLSFYKLAAEIEPEPITQRSPQILDDHFQAYEFMGILSTLAYIKNQLSKVKDLHSLFRNIFGILINIRPGTIRNAIQEMIDSKTFDRAIYNDLRNSVMKEIESNNLKDKLRELSEIIEIELLDNEELAKNPIGQALTVIKNSAKKTIKALNEGLHYL